MAKKPEKKSPARKTGALAFDFNRAAADARRDYPAEMRSITIIDTAEPDAIEKLAHWISSASPEYQRRIMSASQTAREVATRELFQGPAYASMRDVYAGKGCLLASSVTMPLGAYFISLSSEKANAFAFHHELGHLIAKEGLAETAQDMDDLLNDRGDNAALLMNKYEITADCFGVMKGLRDGFLDIEDVRTLIADRRKLAQRNPAYATADALESLLKNYDAGKTAALTPAQLKAAAVAHAKKFAPKINR